jgi:RimJ/RimL family protein N-acetyltransferase
MFAITERLLLRPGWIEDAPALAQLLNDPRVARNLARVPSPYSVSDAQDYLALPQVPTRPQCLICRRDTGEIVGGIGLHGEVMPELGYWIARACWGRGYATEAGQAVVAMADMGLRLPRLAASHALDNPASARVLAKLGFRPTGGVAKLASLGRGTAMSVALFARDRDPADQALAA